MLFVTSYRFKGDRSPESVKALLAKFAERGATEGEVAHYVATDGRGGVIISENDSMESGYENSLHYAPWLDLKTTPVMRIEDALPVIMKVHA